MFVIVSLIDIGESLYYPGHFCGGVILYV